MNEINQKEYVSRIKEDYTPHSRTKLDELKELDGKVKLMPTVFAFTFGIISALILGVGMCLAMQVIGASLMSSAALTAVGVIVGCIGIALCVANYFIYKALLNARKQKYGGQILSISDELLNN